MLISVDLKVVCNGRVDCPDESDETECDSIALESSYLRSVPPVPSGMTSHNTLKSFSESRVKAHFILGI